MENDRNKLPEENFKDETAKAIVNLRNMLNVRLEEIAKILDKKSE